MHVVTVKAPANCREVQAELLKRANEAANDLLVTGERVLVVYSKDGATIYCDAGNSRV